MKLQTFLSELKRRRVVRVAAVYAVVAFVLVQVADLLVPALLLPDWVVRLVVLLLILGFPVALVVAWAFELTPEGVIRTEQPLPPDAREAEGEGDASAPLRPGFRVALYGGLAALGGLGILLLLVRPAQELPTTLDTGTEEEAPSLAVLPFVNMSPDPDQEHFSDGITEDLITHLSRIEGIRVTSRTSVMRFKQSELPISDIARELGVTHVLEGSVRRENDHVRVNAQLIDAATDTHLWADIYDRELTGIFRIQSEITEEISRALQQRLSPTDRDWIAEGGTGSLTAYDLLLRGRDYLGRPGRGDARRLELAAGFFRRALEEDPGYARAYAGLADVFRHTVGLPIIPIRRDSVLAYGRSAVELDPELVEGATALGFGYLYAQDWDRAEAQFRRALSLDRSQADAMEGLSILGHLAGRLDEAARWQLRALEVDPLAPERLHRAGQLLFDLGDLDGAEESFRRAVALAPDYPEPTLHLALIHLLRRQGEMGDELMRGLVSVADHDGVYFALGHYEALRGRHEAAEAWFSRTPLSDFGASAVIRAGLAKARGEDARARELLEGPDAMVMEWERQGYLIPPLHPLYHRIIHDDPDGALEVLREGWRGGLRWIEDPPNVGMYWIDENPAMAPLRDDPRFQAMLREIRTGLDSMRALVDLGLP